MSSFELYLIILSGNLSMFFGIVGSIVFLTISVYVIANCDDFTDEDWVPIKKSFLLAIGCGLIATICPSTSKMAAIYILPKIVNNVDSQKLPPELTSLATEWLKDIKKEH